jgi:hypothetical protein
VSRRRGEQVVFAVVVTCLLILAAGGFAAAITTNRDLNAALQAEVHHHCITDIAASNAQRKLDLALAAANNAYLAVLRGEQAKASAIDHTLIAAQTRWLEATQHARLDNLPPYRNPARCLTR